MNTPLKYKTPIRVNFKRLASVVLSVAMLTTAQGNLMKVEAAGRMEYVKYIFKGRAVRLPLADIRIDSEKLTARKGEVAPIIMNSRAMVPVRMISEKLGASVAWNAKTEEVTLRKEGKDIVLKIGSSQAKVNNEKKSLPGRVAPVIVSDRTMLPVRFLAEEFSLKVDYDAKTNRIVLTTPTERTLTEEEQMKILGSVEMESPVLPPKEVESGQQIALNTEGGTQTEPVSSEGSELSAVEPSVQSPVLPQAPAKPATPEETQNPQEPAVPEPPSKPQEPSGEGNSDNSEKTSGGDREVKEEDTKPQEPSETQPKNTVEQPQNLPSGKKLDYLLEQVTLGEERFVIKGAASLSHHNFYMSAPERLVIDIKGGFLNSELEQNKIYSSGAFISQMNSFFYSEENRLRITLSLAADVLRKEIQLQKSGDDLIVQYRSSKPQNSNLQFKFDRVTANLSLKIAGSYAVNDLSEDSSSKTLQFTLPYENSGLKNEGRNFNNNLIRKIEVNTVDGISRVTLHLKERIAYNMVENGMSGKVEIQLTKEQRSTPLIVIDPGHGAKDPGAIAKSTGMTEKALNLMVSLKLRDILVREGYQVMMTRETDTYPELRERAILANRNEADIFVSIHHNAGRSAVHGLETLYYPTEDNKRLADLIRVEMARASGAYDRGLRKRPDLVVLNSTHVPAVLLELGYMTNPAELRKLSDDAYQSRLAEGIANGIRAYIAAY